MTTKQKTIFIISCIVALAALLALSFATGRYSVKAPAQTTQTIEKIVYKDRVVEKVVYKDRTKTRIVRENITTTAPDGTSSTKSTETIAEDTSTNIDAQKTVYVDRFIDRDISTQTSAVESDWHISLLAGVDQNIVQSFDLRESWVAGAKIDRRIIGPLTGGLWVVGNKSQQSAGISLGLEF